MGKVTLTEKLIRNYLSLSLAAIVIIGGYSYYAARKALMQRTFEQLTSVREMKKSRIQAFFRDRLAEISLVAGFDDVKKLLADLQEGRNTPATEAPLHDLNAYLVSNGYYISIYVCPEDGRFMFVDRSGRTGFGDPANDRNSPLPAGFRDILHRMLQHPEPALQDLRENREDGGISMLAGCPVKDTEGKVRGYVVLVLPVDVINAMMLDSNPQNGLGVSGESYIVGKDLLMRSSSRFIPNSVLHTRVVTVATAEVFRGRPGTRIFPDYREIRVLGSYSTLEIPGLEWAITAEIDLNEAMVPVTRLESRIMILTLSLAIVVFLVTFLFSRKITRPVVKLQKAAQRIGKGELDTTVEISSQDEIGDLARSFNDMTDRIREKNAELERERHQRLRSVIDGQETERQRLSRELHDGLGQLLFAIRLKLEQTENAGPEKTLAIIHEVNAMFSKVIDEVRRMSDDLKPASLDDFGLVRALRNFAEETEEQYGIRMSVTADGIHEGLNTKTATYLFRIAQEAINNVIRHSGAGRVSISLSREGDQLLMRIQDDGKGFIFDERNPSKGHGINNMRERILLLGGAFRLTTAPNKGTILEMKVPVN